jgi:hypothetical protein
MTHSPNFPGAWVSYFINLGMPEFQVAETLLGLAQSIFLLYFFNAQNSQLLFGLTLVNVPPKKIIIR